MSISKSLSFIHGLININSSDDDIIQLKLDGCVRRACALDVAYFTSSNFFYELFESNTEKLFAFVHNFDSFATPFKIDEDSGKWIQIIDLQKRGWEGQFLLETDDHDAVAYNFLNGIVFPINLSWVALALPQCDIALVFEIDSRRSPFDWMLPFSYPRETALELLRTCLDTGSFSEISKILLGK